MKPATFGWCKHEVASVLVVTGLLPHCPIGEVGLLVRHHVVWVSRPVAEALSKLWIVVLVEERQAHTWNTCLPQDGEIPYRQLAAQWLVDFLQEWCSIGSSAWSLLPTSWIFKGSSSYNGIVKWGPCSWTHTACFCHHVHSVYVSIVSTLGNWWQGLANVKSFLSPWLLRTFAMVDAFWSVSTCNTQVFTLHAVTRMSVYRRPYLCLPVLLPVS